MAEGTAGPDTGAIGWPDQGAGDPISSVRIDQLLAETRGEH